MNIIRDLLFLIVGFILGRGRLPTPHQIMDGFLRIIFHRFQGVFCSCPKSKVDKHQLSSGKDVELSNDFYKDKQAKNHTVTPKCKNVDKLDIQFDSALGSEMSSSESYCHSDHHSVQLGLQTGVSNESLDISTSKDCAITSKHEKFPKTK